MWTSKIKYQIVIFDSMLSSFYLMVSSFFSKANRSGNATNSGRTSARNEIGESLEKDAILWNELFSTICPIHWS